MLTFKIIIVPVDFSDHSLRALPYAISLAERFDAKLKIVYVSEPSLQVSDAAWVHVDDRAIDEKHLAECRRNMQKLVLNQIPDDVPADAEILSGNPVDRIIRYAEDVNADLIVMATHGRSGLSHVLMGSTAEHVVRRAPCPVLTLKHPMLVKRESESD